MKSVVRISPRDAEDFAWGRLALFQNEHYAARVIGALHELDSRSKPNALKQAASVRHCLTQAREYSAAASSVSLATKPVLLYYSIMSLALAEVLIKQSGESRLEKLREKHNCHGLILKVAKVPSLSDALSLASSSLVAQAQSSANGEPNGTFEVWRRSASEYPMGGESHHSVSSVGGSQISYSSIMDADPGKGIPRLPAGGMSLARCLSNIPSLMDINEQLGLVSPLVRASLRRQFDIETGVGSIDLAVHPSHRALINALEQKMRFRAGMVNAVQVREMPSGFILSCPLDVMERAFEFPPATHIDSANFVFHVEDNPLNEFGYFYVALHIAGTFARYYPDVWMKNIEGNTPLSCAVNELCEAASARVPLLTLSELTQAYHVQKP